MNHRDPNVPLRHQIRQKLGGLSCRIIGHRPTLMHHSTANDSAADWPVNVDVGVSCKRCYQRIGD